MHGYETDLKEAIAKGYNIRIAAKIRNGSDKVLLVKRASKDNYAGVWEIPGGAVEQGETLEQGLRREVSEETGLTVTRVVRYIRHFDFHNIETGKTTRKFCFEVVVTGTIKTSFEHQAFRWFSLRSIQRLKVQGTAEPYDIWPDHFAIISQA